MCIIVAVDKGAKLPTWHTMETCFERNSDGAGFMYNNNGKVIIKKGFMTFKEFKKAFRLAKRHFTGDTSVVMHFRIKTHGEVSKECCHPFALDGKLDMLRLTNCECNMGVAHNGILSAMNSNAKMSDTMDYVLHVLYPLSKMSRKFLTNKYARGIIEQTLEGCRLAVLDGTGTITRFGSWECEEGVYYSNTSYKQPRYAYKSANTYAGYDWSAWTNGYYDPYGYGTAVKQALPAAENVSPADDWDDDYTLNAPNLACYELCANRAQCEMTGWTCKNDDEVWQALKKTDAWLTESDKEWALNLDKWD